MSHRSSLQHPLHLPLCLLTFSVNMRKPHTIFVLRSRSPTDSIIPQSILSTMRPLLKLPPLTILWNACLLSVRFYSPNETVSHPIIVSNFQTQRGADGSRETEFLCFFCKLWILLSSILFQTAKIVGTKKSLTLSRVLWLSWKVKIGLRNIKRTR